MSFVIPAPKATTACQLANTCPPPAIHHFAKKQKQFEVTKSTDFYVNNISIKFPAGVNDVNIRNKAATLFATMQRVDPELILLPLKKSDSDLPVILSGSSFPTETHLLKHYFSIPSFASQSAKVHCYLQTSKRFSDIKFNNFVHSHLQKSRIWIDSHDIESFDVTQVGWLANKHTEHCSCKSLLDEAKKIPPEALHEHMQLNVRTVQYYKEANAYTRAFVFEMDRNTSNDHLSDIFTRFSHASDLTLVPMNSNFDIGGIIKSHFLEHNSTLTNFRSIHVDNLFGLDAPIIESSSGDTTTIREIFATSEDGKHPFLSLVQYNSKRVNFLIPTDKKEWATEIIHEFIHDYLPKNITQEYRNLVSLPDNLPRIVGTREVPNQISVFIQSAKTKTASKPTQSPSTFLVTSDFTSPPRTPWQSYARAVRQNATNNRKKPPPSRSKSPYWKSLLIVVSQ